MLPAAMGAAVATGKPLVLCDGDASTMMHLAEFETMVRYNMPLLVIVMNNEALGAEYGPLVLPRHATDQGAFEDATGTASRAARTAKAAEKRMSLRD